MEALKTNKALKAQIEDMKIEREEANNTLENIQGQLDAANAQLVEKDETIATLTVQKEEAIATLTAQKEAAVEAQENTAAQLQDVSTDLEKTQAELAESEESTNAKAVELAASAGHQAKVILEDSTKSNTDLHAEYRKLQQSNPAEASAFWQENKAALLAG